MRFGSEKTPAPALNTHNADLPKQTEKKMKKENYFSMNVTSVVNFLYFYFIVSVLQQRLSRQSEQ